MRFHDTLTDRLVDFEPRDPGRVSMYACGPTVYDVPHLGHGRTALVFDMMRRYLRWSGYEVTYVSNVTDIDDKIIARAAEAGTTEAQLAARYTDAYWAELDRLDVERPTAPHATEFVDQMVALIVTLVEAGKAYVIEGEGVYFEVAGYDGYGELSKRDRDALLESAGARVDVDTRKRSPIDFALWKSAKPGEPTWDSPWGPGRPGWHIECAAMSLEVLGDGFDIHGGGDDLTFPHHENERAEAEAAGHPFARYWIHSAMVNIDGEKMSKSLGNFTNLAEALDAVGPRAFRLAVLRPHYRSPIELGRDALEDAARAVDRLDAFVRRADGAGVRVGDVPARDVEALDDEVVARFRTAMDDDFGSPSAFAAIFDAVADANRAIDTGDTARAAVLLTTVVELCGVLGLSLDASAGSEAGDGSGAGTDAAEITALVEAREAARAAKDFAEADRIRDELTARGVTVEDTASGPVWRR